ncbi:DNA-binding NtrC family response regulator [Neorhizobium huautlense]|uniref:DNA-binding NtrC family response regulator n=1 Tax=Neorhizobium huautlense TaxID=67774 RepID=A0ABT9Q0F7_9HYPH|nr:response regulator [Neorhizobium huautlense]MDP9840203.1 DNA-binding NtrC family response regulator [Neorhizobium huautlense]
MNTIRHTVLVVEDEALIRFAVADALEDAGYDVLEAASVLEAIGQLGLNEDIDLVVTDVDMPGALSGIDLARMISDCAPHIGVIVSSARCGEELTDIPAAAHCLPKPCTAQKMLSTIETMLKGRALVGDESFRRRA